VDRLLFFDDPKHNPHRKKQDSTVDPGRPGLFPVAGRTIFLYIS